MRIYIKGYYGYQNFGDELLLLGLLQRLEKEYTPEKIYIESQDSAWLHTRLQNCKEFVKTNIDNIVCVSSSGKYKHAYDLIVFGGGEVVSDARPRPYNGRNYLLGWIKQIVFERYIIVGGIGTPKKVGTGLLYRVLLGRAERVVVRDETSYAVAKMYTDQVEHYHDFAHDVLATISPQTPSSPTYMLVNVNTYMRNEQVKEILRTAYKKNSDCTRYVLPAAWGSDNLLMKQVQEIIPGSKELDWRGLSLEETIGWIVHAKELWGTRLHILLVRHYFDGSYIPFVYQEKIEKCLLHDTQKE